MSGPISAWSTEQEGSVTTASGKQQARRAQSQAPEPRLFLSRALVVRYLSLKYLYFCVLFGKLRPGK